MSFDALNVAAYRVPPESQRPPKAAVRSKFGQQVLWLERKDGGYHLSQEDLEPYRLLGDEVDDILQTLKDSGTPLGAGDDLLSMMEDARKMNPESRTKVEIKMSLFLEKYSQLPAWVDQDQLQRGQEVFLAYLPVASLSLYYRSLVAGFSIPKIAAVVRATAYLSPPSRPDQVLQRLLDTGELTTACTGLGLEALLPGGIGWKTALYVRFLHAKVRLSLMNRKGKKKWDVEAYGIPINQEDMAATLLAFSVNVLFGIDLISGVTLPRQQKLDYLALWRYLGWLLGVETDYGERQQGLPSMDELPPLDPCGPGVGCEIPDTIMNSNAILQSVIFHLLEPDESSVEIAHHLLKITDRKPPSSSFDKIPEAFYKNELFYYRSYNCRRMIGDPLADALELPFHPNPWMRLKIRLKSTFFLSMFRAYTLATIWIPPFRRFVISWHEHALVRFHEAWTKSHQAKLSNALSKGEKASVLDDEPWTDGSGHVKPKSASLCPFAMVASPSRS
jgi:ER-bound oxygenase mpaB/B'/Rubber oxygenase, catalytic domain